MYSYYYFIGGSWDGVKKPKADQNKHERFVEVAELPSIMPYSDVNTTLNMPKIERYKLVAVDDVRFGHGYQVAVYIYGHTFEG